jgi:3-hydroxyisobutyrate dehydrogenase-like beta-hydroxyacid dehydrogenase
MSDSSKMNVVVVGIGAMGGGMARALLDSKMMGVVMGYDKSTEAVERFYEESRQAQKAAARIPTSLRDSISKDTHVALISLVNEAQCEQVCFEGDENLLNLMSQGSCVVLTSTVTCA